MTKTPGKLVKLLVLQNETVKSGQSLAWFENTADHNKYVLTAPIEGKISFPTVIHENQLFGMNQEVFYIIRNDEEFFGEMVIPQDNMGKIKEGEQVLIKLKAYPSEEYGMIRGRITYITEVPNKDNVFISKVDFKLKDTSDLKKPIHLKQGMMADAEIITQDATILQRLSRNFFKVMDNK
jgi:HlyD family secretion protein